MLVAGAFVGAAASGGRLRATKPLTFFRLTYETGTIVERADLPPTARTSCLRPPGTAIPFGRFLSRTDRIGAAPLGLPDASLLSLSSDGRAGRVAQPCLRRLDGGGHAGARVDSGGCAAGDRRARARGRLGARWVRPRDRPPRRLDGASGISARHGALPDHRLHLPHPLLPRRAAHRLCRSPALQRRQRRSRRGRSRRHEDDAGDRFPGAARRGLVARRHRGLVHRGSQSALLGHHPPGVDARRTGAHRY